MSRNKKRELESLPLFPDHVADYAVKGGNGMTPDMVENLKYNLKQDAIEEKIHEVMDECIEAAILANDQNGGPEITYGELQAMLRSALLTAANLWGL